MFKEYEYSDVMNTRGYVRFEPFLVMNIQTMVI